MAVVNNASHKNKSIVVFSWLVLLYFLKYTMGSILIQTKKRPRMAHTGNTHLLCKGKYHSKASLQFDSLVNVSLLECGKDHKSKPVRLETIHALILPP